MRTFDERFVKKSVVGEEGISPAQPDLEQIELTLEVGGKEQEVCIDIGDHVYTERRRKYWAPLYFLDGEKEELVCVLGFITSIDVRQDISPENPLPYAAIASPSKDKLTKETWEKHKREIRTRQAAFGSAVVAVSAGVVGSIFYAIKRAKR